MKTCLRSLLWLTSCQKELNNKRKINLSAQILSGAITREQALQEIGEPFDTPENLENLKAYVIKKLDIDNSAFDEIFKRENKFYTDYPSYYKAIYSNVKYFKWIITKLYSYKPMSIDSSESLNK